MADYKRLVSYIYNYESGIRRKNVGFSRVESKNGQCKVTIHITTGTSSHAPLKVYLFHRNGMKIEGIFFGEMSVKNGTGDFRGETSTFSLMDSGYSLDDISGVLVLLNEDKFFGSQWDDQEIQIRNFEEYDKDKIAREKEDKLVRSILIEPDDINDMKMQDKLADQIRKPVYEEVLQAAEMEQEIQAAKMDKEAQEKEIAPVSEVVEETEKEMQVFFKKEEGKAEESPQVSMQEKLQEGLWEQSIVQKVDVCQAEVGEEVSASVESSAKVSYTAESAESEKDEGEKEDSLEASSIYEDCCCSEHYPECVRNVLRNFPSVKPFPESNPENWVRIEPKDIGMLPVETWILANNSFLLHGYYNYRHLIFGVLQVENGMQYVIGVPGILQSTEQTMAGMFGFHRFLASQAQDGKQGNFGYWIQQIVL